jgi:predicted acylesterase/phospholipase RssA
MKALSIAGGGVRGIALAGVLRAGEMMGHYHPHRYDIITGDSFGALVAALAANHWSPLEMASFFERSDFKGLLSGWIPWKIRELGILAKPVELNRVAAYLDSLQLEPVNGLVINAWDAEDNAQVLYCHRKPEGVIESATVKTVWVENAFTDLGFGTVLTRSMALPGLVADSRRWMDGGLGEHPPLSFLPADADVTAIVLGFPGTVNRGGDTTPNGLLKRALYAYEVTAATRHRMALARFAKLKVIDPRLYDLASPVKNVDTADFNIDRDTKRALFRQGKLGSYSQWG